MSESINPDRGEVAITLDGQSYPMRPSYEAQVAIEQSLGVSMDELFVRARRLARAMSDDSASTAGIGFKVHEMAVIICECVRAAGKARDDAMLQRWTVDRVGELIVKDRFSFNDPITSLIMAAVFGGSDPKKAEVASPASESPAAAS